MHLCISWVVVVCHVVMCWTDLTFVTTVATGGCVKFFQLCKFSRKQRLSLQNLCKIMKFTHLFGRNTHNFTQRLLDVGYLHIHFNFNKKKDKTNLYWLLWFVFGNVRFALLYYGALSMNIVHPELSNVLTYFSRMCDVLRMYSCPACVGGWVALLMTAGVMGEGVGEFNVNSMNRSLHASNICAISFPINLDSCRLSPFHAGREYITHIFLKYLYSQFVFHSTHSWMFWLLQGPPDL